MRKLVFLVLLLGFGNSLPAKFMRPENAPVDRLVRNVTAHLAENPESAEAWYLLGRIHYLALHQKSATLGVYERPDELPSIAPFQTEQGDSIKASEALSHLTEGRKALEKAIELDEKNGLYHLTLGSLVREYGQLHRRGLFKDTPDAPEPESDDRLAERFLKSFTLSREDDAGQTHTPLLGLSSMVSYEAAQSYLAVKPDGEAAKELAAHMEKLQELKPGPITPLVFSHDRSSTRMADVIDEKRRVKFDLTGLGHAASYPWPKETAAFLVWDPESEGQIADGTDLFGFYTWQIFWTDGFQPLQMLDDNRDGKLAGTELEGIAAWTDRNGNGASDPGEVVSLGAHGIFSLKTKAQEADGPHLLRRDGVQDSKGYRPLWDWMANPLAP
jgi:hypothetical protein